nr:hypothetical protein [Mucilaginibacter sp. L294]
MEDFDSKLNTFFGKFTNAVKQYIPNMIAETAVEHYKNALISKSWNGKAYAPYKNKKREPKKGSLMMRSMQLFNSIKPKSVTPGKVVISAGNSRVPYARAHNEGLTINHPARTENIIRNRHTRGKLGKMFGGMGAFRKGTTSGQGLSFKAYSVKMPQRQFMGKNPLLLGEIKTRFKTTFKDHLK